MNECVNKKKREIKWVSIKISFLRKEEYADNAIELWNVRSH